MNSLLDNLAVRLCQQPATLTGTTKCLMLDRAGFRSAVFLWAIGADAALDGSNYWTPSLEESDTTADADFTAVAAADIINNGLAVVDSTSEDSTVQIAEYRGSKRYVRLKLTETGTLSGPHCVVGLLGLPNSMPKGDVAAGTSAT